MPSRSGMGLGPGSYTVHQSLAVDASVSYLFAALMWGGTLHLIGRDRASDAERLGDYIRQEQIDYFKVAPSYLAALLAGAEPERLCRAVRSWWEARRLGEV